MRGFGAADTEEAAIATHLLQFVASCGEAVLGCEIAGEIGHVTSAAWILNRDSSRVLLVFGAKENAWKLPGAHCETQNGAELFQVARREALRASGGVADGNRATIFAISKQEIPAYWNTPAHLHFELVFRLDALETVDLPRGAKWFSLANAAMLGSDSIAHLVRKTSALSQETTHL
ncbi:hypothetical protein B1R32_106114 [Abditibacterium utsteinense]|uniref:Nudix hydrolase domain-containing protein n=1 Tax=Abditibacterium utsteinense TaxID=1960156 RepID=A0A2S8SU15_9BACT|nr:hypothetical protein B1R32_106114 [Abditibacterium utsteinense]